MRKLDTALLRIGLTFGACFALLIGIEVGLLSTKFRGEGMLFHWQAWLLAGIFVFTLRDLLSSTYCHACQEWDVPTFRGLFTTGTGILCSSCAMVQVNQ